ncbi:hypothetical protein [Turkeypox virus]|uniref:Uncharacterized protein n=1 Tax=Turkeypox virus TaxID=336486 RepID=A0A0M3ZPK1_9POXV|nr:hypothetical protein ASN15_gp040 [Turkeypox virus]ALA62414.1 hypothetical protein [Turkeypox virus]
MDSVKNIVFVISNFTKKDYHRIKKLDYVYLIICKEEINSIPSISGYIELVEPISPKVLLDINPSIWFESESHKNNIINLYKKKDSYEEYNNTKRECKRMIDLSVFDYYK